MSNFSGGVISNDIEMTKDVVLSKIYHLIDKEPNELISSLKISGVKISDTASKRELIDKSIDALYSNKTFQREVSKHIAVTSPKFINGTVTTPEFSNGSGDIMEKLSGLFGGGGSGGEGGSSGGGGSTMPQVTVGADPISAIAGAIGSIFSFASAKTNKNAQKDADKNKLIQSLLQDDDKKTNWLPIVIIGGVLLIGGAIAFITLRGNNN